MFQWLIILDLAVRTREEFYPSSLYWCYCQQRNIEISIGDLRLLIITNHIISHDCPEEEYDFVSYLLFTHIIYRYAETAKKVSAIRRHDPLHPRDRAAYWIEHVINFGGKYLIPPVFELSFFQYYMLDVFAFLLTCFFVLLLVTFYLLRFCLRLGCRVVGLGRKPKQE